MRKQTLEEKLIQFIFLMRRTFQEKSQKNKHFNFFSLLRLSTLSFIQAKKNPTMKEIASWLKITPPSVTSLIDSFVKPGLIKREADKKDRRIIRLKITQKGKKILRESQRENKTRIKKFISKLSPRDQKDLLRILNNFYKIFLKENL